MSKRFRNISRDTLLCNYDILGKKITIMFSIMFLKCHLNMFVLAELCWMSLFDVGSPKLLSTSQQVKGVVNVTQVVARGMVERKKGAIVNISSILSQRTLKNNYIYCAAKGALDQLTRCQAVELGPFNVRVNSIHPTLVGTPYVKAILSQDPGFIDGLVERGPSNQAASIEDVVNATLFLLSDKADMINGAFLPVDGGYWCT